MRRYPMSSIVGALKRMGFNPTKENDHFISYLRFEANDSICILILDGSKPDVIEDDLVRSLAGNGVDLTQFWNEYEAYERESPT